MIRLMQCLILSSVLLAASFSYGFSENLPNPSDDSDFYEEGQPAPDKVELGRALFFDKILSGNRNISCASCHHPLTFFSDSLSLGVGEGGRGLGPARDTGMGLGAIHERVPRQSPVLFNLGAREFTRLFFDGRAELDPSQVTGFKTPAGDRLPNGLENLLAAQAMFPVTSATEMAGQPGENSIADNSARGDLPAIWEILGNRLRSVPGYVSEFRKVFSLAPDEIQYVHAANAISAYISRTFRSDRSPFDAYLRGDRTRLSARQIEGLQLFYGKAKCVQCHSGIFQTDHQFHAIAIPQIGPGHGDGPEGYEDYGRGAVTHQEADRYRFLTPSLRNVTMTGPWGHDGAYNSLEAIVRHHLDPDKAINLYQPGQAVLPFRADLSALDFKAYFDLEAKTSLILANELTRTPLTDSEVQALLDFLEALTDQSLSHLRHDIVTSVPSGLPIWD